MSSPYVGEIRMFAGNFAPAGWMFCNGSLLAISDYQVLFQLIGTAYGGDGVNTFALPNLQSRIPVHPDGGSFPYASLGGVETVTLTVQQIPLHNHAAIGVSGSANGVASPTNNTWGGVTASSPYTDQAADSTMNPGSIGPAGGSQPHNNFMPYLCVNFIISMFGVFPSQT